MVKMAALAGLAFAVIGVINWRSPPAGFPAPAQVYNAAIEAVPGVFVTSAQLETFNGARAWEVRGTAQGGTAWLIDVLETGEVDMKEPVAHHPLASVIVPIPDF